MDAKWYRRQVIWILNDMDAKWYRRQVTWIPREGEGEGEGKGEGEVRENLDTANKSSINK